MKDLQTSTIDFWDYTENSAVGTTNLIEHFSDCAFPKGHIYVGMWCNSILRFWMGDFLFSKDFSIISEE